MSTQNVYSPDYDNQGNPKKSIPELKDAIENAVVDAENFASATSSFTDDNGNTYQKGAKGWAADAEGYKNTAQTEASNASSSATDAANSASAAQADADRAEEESTLTAYSLRPDKNLIGQSKYENVFPISKSGGSFANFPTSYQSNLPLTISAAVVVETSGTVNFTRLRLQDANGNKVEDASFQQVGSSNVWAVIGHTFASPSTTDARYNVTFRADASFTLKMASITPERDPSVFFRELIADIKKAGTLARDTIQTAAEEASKVVGLINDRDDLINDSSPNGRPAFVDAYWSPDRGMVYQSDRGPDLSVPQQYDHYVDPTAADGGDGSLSSPYDTLSDAVSAASNGDSVGVKVQGTWTPGPQVPLQYGLGRIAKVIKDARIVALGDSFVDRIGAGVIPWAVAGLPKTRWAAIGGNAQSAWHKLQGFGVTNQSADTQKKMRMGDYMNSSASPEFWNVPIHHIQLLYGSTDTLGTDGEIMKCGIGRAVNTTGADRFNDSPFNDIFGAHKKGLGELQNDELHLRLLSWHPTDGTLRSGRTIEVLDSFDGDSLTQAYDPTSDIRGYISKNESPSGRSDGLAGELNAFYPDLTLSRGTDFDGLPSFVGSIRDQAAGTDAVPNTGKYLHLNGQICYVGAKESPKQGTYYQRLGGDSWPLAGHGNDTAATDTSGERKQYSKQQALRFFDVTTLDQNQQPVFFILHANEKAPTPEQVYTQCDNITTVWDDICSQLSLPEPYYLFIHPHKTPQSTGYSSVLEESTFAYGMYPFCRNNRRCAYYSFYRWSRAIRLDGRTEAEKWKAQMGLDQVEYQRFRPSMEGPIDMDGNKFVSDGIHPTSRGNKVMGKALAEAIRESM